MAQRPSNQPLRSKTMRNKAERSGNPRRPTEIAGSQTEPSGTTRRRAARNSNQLP
jgi:hypothetical protein